ncbi:MAG: hypothetical protein HY553_03090 [Elusimicrobia bacterium]|nr:hypothetical protein [Elusimicrobiota bacterium]
MSRLRSGQAAAFGALGLVLAASATLFTAASAGRAEPTDVGVLLSDTRALAEGHAAAMLGSVERLRSAVDLPRGPHGDHRDADAESMLADVERLEALARLLGDQRPALRHVSAGPAGDFGTLRALGLMLAGEGRSVSAHGRAMDDHARAMEELASDAGVALEDARVILNTGTAMAAAGERVRLSGEALAESGERSLRSLGR